MFTPEAVAGLSHLSRSCSADKDLGSEECKAVVVQCTYSPEGPFLHFALGCA